MKKKDKTKRKEKSKNKKNFNITIPTTTLYLLKALKNEILSYIEKRAVDIWWRGTKNVSCYK